VSRSTPRWFCDAFDGAFVAAFFAAFESDVANEFGCAALGSAGDAAGPVAYRKIVCGVPLEIGEVNAFISIIPTAA